MTDTLKALSTPNAPNAPKLRTRQYAGIPLKTLKESKEVETISIVSELDDTPVDLVLQYNMASAVEKAAKDQKKEIKATLLPLAREHVFAHNVGGLPHVTSVNLEDSTGSRVQFQFQNSYPDQNKDSVTDLFGKIRNKNNEPVDINNYFKTQLNVDLNTDVFYDEKGKFRRKMYDDFRFAIDTVCAGYGVENPLKCNKSVKPRDNFHTDRFTDFDLLTNELFDETLKPKKVMKSLAGGEIKEVVENKKNLWSFIKDRLASRGSQ